MFVHNKRLQYTVRVSQPDPGLANLLLEQFGGPQGELAAACRYFTQALAEEDPGRKDMLLDIATEELSHPNPVFHGDTLFCETEVLDVRPSKSKPDRGTVKVHTRVLNQDGTLVAEFKRLVLVPKRPGG